MTALALLSMIAPTAAGVPQGPASAAASGFGGLLAALSQTDAGPSEAMGGQIESEPVESEPEQGEATVQTPTEELPVRFMPVAHALVYEDREQLLPVAGLNPSAAGHDQIGAGTAVPHFVGDKGATSGGSPLQPQPPATETGPTAGPTTDIPETLGLSPAAVQPAQASARTHIPATPTPALAVVAAPAPLRPLADRTSRPIEAQTAGVSEASTASDPTSGVQKSATAAAPTGPEQPVKPAASFAATAATAAREIARGGEARAPAPDMPPVDEGATAQTQGPSATRETALSQLSRVAIEATAQIAAQILRRLEGRSTRFEMALRPDELGRVDVKLDIDAEGRLKARMAFDNPAAATDLRGRADELRRQLEDAGFHMADDAFEFAERDSGSSAFDRGQDPRNGPSHAFAQASRLNSEIDVDQPPRWLTLSLSPSGVDMKV